MPGDDERRPRGIAGDRAIVRALRRHPRLLAQLLLGMAIVVIVGAAAARAVDNRLVGTVIGIAGAFVVIEWLVRAVASVDDG